MSTYTLTGSGVQLLTADTTALHVSITTLSPFGGIGNANPPNHYHQALLRFGDGTGYWIPTPVEGGPQWIGLPNGCDRIGYACEGGAAISVVEVIGGTSPFAGPAGPAGSAGASGAAGPAGPAGPAGSAAAIRIAQVIVAGSPQSTIDFASIPSTFTDLLLTLVARATGANQYQALQVRLNGDSGAHYDWVIFDTSGSFTTPGSNQGNMDYIVGGGATANYASSAQLWIPGYLGTTFFKNVNSQSGILAGLTRVAAASVTWKSTTAVNEITLLLDANQFAVGSVATLYGVT